jgi:hypothetical protein
MPTDVMTWSQLALFAAGTVAAIVWTVGHLFKTMGTSYGAIIAALQNQNNTQQVQLNEQGNKIVELRTTADKLKVTVAQADEDCDEKIQKLAAKHASDVALLSRSHSESSIAIADLQKQVNGQT